MFKAVALLACVLLATAACSDDDDDGSAEDAPSTESDAETEAEPSSEPERPDGPAAELSEATGGNGVFTAAALLGTDLEGAGYAQEEYVASGTATSYAAEGELTEDGMWSFAPADEAPYRTRIVVRRPADEADFSGTVIVEWMNVSGGVDAEPDWLSLHEEIVRQGHAWVGVSAQRIGIEGGPVLVAVDAGAGLAGKGIKAIDPERYGTLEHPGDGYAFDIYTQIARAIRTDAVDGLRPATVIAAGESQSAFALVTYYNGVQPLTEAFDSFYVHSRGGSGMPLVGPGESADIAGAIGAARSTFRTDLDAPVLDLQAEGDMTSVLNSYAARQPDGDRFRLWEVAGTAHADRHLLGSTADTFDCGVPINDGPLHVVAKAGLRALVTWVEDGEAPPEAPRVEVTEGAAPQITRDADGIATGGIRTSPVDVPVAVLSGQPGPAPSTICLLLGSTTPLPAARLAELYPSEADYLERYEAATDAAIEAGFVLDEDREALLAYANPAALAG